jgi:arylsulfatase A-like enzyme
VVAAGAPNVLVVLFDDVGFSDFGCYGSPIKTPTIDRLAAEPAL